MTLLELVRKEAEAAGRALASLNDEGASDALRAAAMLVRERRADILAANSVDYEAGRGELDEGTLDRLRLDENRVTALAEQLEAMADLDPLEREARSWTLPNGLRVSERRVPIGTVGANFEARPNVALDVAGQLLKSLNAGVLRTGAAALRTVTVLVDEVLRPGLERAGLPAEAIGLVRAPEREGARVLVSLPDEIPLVILRGSGAGTVELARLAAENGVRTLAHAEGGGVLYLHSSAKPAKALALAEASLDRLGVCNRLNLALVDRKAPPSLLADLVDLLDRLGLELRGTPAVVGEDERIKPLDARVGYEWANDPERVATVTIHSVDGVTEALAVANAETSGLAASIVTEDAAAAQAFLDGYRGTTALWNATPRFTDGFELTGSPETGINVGLDLGPRGPVTYRDLWLRQYRVVGDGTQRRS
jgi:glutamate-5-semialdehyde dehydrogenase